MRKCNCGSIIPIRIKIDNKYRNLQNRKQCLTCLPFMESPYSRNQEERKIKAVVNNRIKQRRYANKFKEENGEWPANLKRRDKKERLIAEFGGKCIRCSYDKCLSALCFHHRDPETKKLSLTTREMVFSYERLLEEAKKCDLLCLNCHAEVHEGIHCVS